MHVGASPIATFLGGVAVGCVAAVALYEIRCRKCGVLTQSAFHSRNMDPKIRDSEGSLDGHHVDIFEDEVLEEMFTRNIQFFGIEGQARVSRGFVIVVGLGGVGSHAAHLLLRSGVSKLRLIDFDQVTLSSLNRHALATRADVGLSKSECLKIGSVMVQYASRLCVLYPICTASAVVRLDEKNAAAHTTAWSGSLFLYPAFVRHFESIFPEACVEARVMMYTQEVEADVLAGNPDFVLDAIDNIETKVSLLAACKKRGIPVLSVAGAGAKMDPTRLRIADISESVVDPLARAMRQRLKRDYDITSGITVVFSTEKPCCHLVPVEEGQDPLDFQVVPNFRIRTIPVLGMLPAIFGMAAAAYITCHLARKLFEPEPVFQVTGPQYEAQLARLQQREEVCFGNSEGPSVGLEEVVYLVREVWRGVSARAPRHVMPGGSKGLNRSTASLTLTRWNASLEATVDNLVLLTFEEADQHDLCQLDELKRTEPAWVAYVEGQLQRVRAELGVG